MSNPFNGTNGTTACPPPFLDPHNFPKNGGYVNGRFCGNYTLLNTTCCLPCPVEQWFYPTSFITSLHAVDKTAILSLISCVFLLLTWLIFPSQQSHRHYLSVGLTFSVVLISMAFLIPLSTQPQMCYNAITPADMFSSPSCGWSGALFQAGGLASGIWVLLKVLWLHLRICWGVTPGRSFAMGSMFAGIVIPAIFLGITIAVSGFSYQLGTVCFLNHEHSFAVLWGWIIAFAILAFIIQLSTSCYIFLIYLQVHKYQRCPGLPQGGGFGPLGSGTSLRSRGTISPKNRYSGYTFPKREWRQTLSRPVSLAHRTGASPRTLPAPTSGGAGMQFNEVDLERTQLSQKWAEISKVFAAQWRSILLCLIMVIESIYFAAAFWTEQVKVTNAEQKNEAVLDFGTCLVSNQENKTACMDYTGPLIMSKGVALGTMAIAALMGLQVFLFLFRSTMYLCWWSLLRHPKSFLLDRWSSYNPKPYELSDYNRGAWLPSTLNDGKDKLVIPAALSALTTEARLRVDGSMRSMTPLHDLEAAQNAHGQHNLPPIPQSPQSPQDQPPKTRYSTYLATRASDVPMPPSPISQIAPPAYPQTPMAGHSYTSGHQHPKILRIRSPPPPRPPRPWSIQRKPMQTVHTSPPTTATSPRAPVPGFETQKLRASGAGSLQAEGAPRAAAVRSPSLAPDPAAAFRDALRLNPVTAFVAPADGSTQRESGERNLSGGEASVSPLVPKGHAGGEEGTEREGFAVGDGDEALEHEHAGPAQPVRGLEAVGSSSGVERSPRLDGGMRRRSKESDGVEQEPEFEDSPVDPDRRLSAAPCPQRSLPTGLSGPTSHPVGGRENEGEGEGEGEVEPPPTPGIGRAY